MNLHRRAIRILHARLGLVSNNAELLTRSEYFTDRVPQSLLTDYHRVDDVPWDGGPGGVDTEIRIVDTPGLPPAIALEPDRVLAVGDWTALEAANSDRRYSLFGNLGFVFRYAAMNPRSVVGKRARLGNTPASCAGCTPNHRASVAPYWSTALDGIHRPSFSASSGPPSASAG